MLVSRLNVKPTDPGVFMKQSSHSHESYADFEKRIRDEIMPLFEAIISGEHIYYTNKNKKACWDAIEDTPCRCPAAIESEGAVDELGMQTDGDPLNSDPLKLEQACATCAIYKDLCPTVVEELGEAFNSIVHILGNKDTAIGDAETLTRELAHSLESRDQENIKIRERLNSDALTGVSNRRHMNERLVEEVNRCHNRRRILSIVMVDIDDFKQYNDTFGHVAGDRVLTKLGEILRGSLRNYDHAFRYGGEEFVVMLPDADTQEALIVGERIRTRFAEVDFRAPSAGHNPGPGGNLTLSGGIVTYRKGMGVVELLECADGALYRAKRNGKNKIELDEALVGV